MRRPASAFQLRSNPPKHACGPLKPSTCQNKSLGFKTWEALLQTLQPFHFSLPLSFESILTTSNISPFLCWSRPFGSCFRNQSRWLLRRISGGSGLSPVYYCI
eukprot:s542_g11.t1